MWRDDAPNLRILLEPIARFPPARHRFSVATEIEIMAPLAHQRAHNSRPELTSSSRHPAMIRQLAGHRHATSPGRLLEEYFVRSWSQSNFILSPHRRLQSSVVAVDDNAGHRNTTGNQKTQLD